MNEELDYAEMLEIPVETVTVRHRERKRRPKDDLSEQLVEQVNDRMEPDPAFAESKPIEREANVSKRGKIARRLILGEFIAVCALCATIFFTNVFMPNSAINTFVRGLFRGNAAAAADTRTHADFVLSSLVKEDVNAEIAVSGSGVLSFTAQCSVYPPCEGTVKAIHGNDESGYTMEIAHSDTFSTVIGGLDYAYLGEGDTAFAQLPVGFSKGEREVRVSFYEGGELLTNCAVDNNALVWN